MIYQGDFVFVENHLCIDSNKYIEKDADGIDRLTEYARHHIDECCVKFSCNSTDFLVNNSNIETLFYLCRNFSADIAFDIEIANSNSAILNSPDLPSRHNKHIEIMSEIRKTIRDLSLTEILNYFVENLELNVQDLAIDTGLSERTVRRYLSGENKDPDKRTVIALCMAMKLPPDIIIMVLLRAEINLPLGNKDNDALLFVIAAMRGKSILEINRYLETVIGVEPLTKKN